MSSIKKIEQVGIIGYGQFGSFIHVLVNKFFGDSVVVTWYDAKNTSKQSQDIAQVAEADVVFIAVPLTVYAETIKNIAPLLGKNTILVDVATVKEHTVSVCKKYIKDNGYICTHPMFGPKSYEKTNGVIDGFRVVITDSTVSKSTLTCIKNLLQRNGFIVIHMSAKDHDKYLAETLFVTHYIGQLVSRSGFVRTTIDTVSFGFLMDAVDSVKNDEQLFKDVYALNKYCKKVVMKMEKNAQSLFS